MTIFLVKIKGDEKKKEKKLARSPGGVADPTRAELSTV